MEELKNKTEIIEKPFDFEIVYSSGSSFSNDSEVLSRKGIFGPGGLDYETSEFLTIQHENQQASRYRSFNVLKINRSIPAEQCKKLLLQMKAIPVSEGKIGSIVIKDQKFAQAVAGHDTAHTLNRAFVSLDEQGSLALFKYTEQWGGVIEYDHRVKKLIVYGDKDMVPIGEHGALYILSVQK